MVFATVIFFRHFASLDGQCLRGFSAYDVALIDVSDAVVDWPECGNLGSTSVLTSPVLMGPNGASPATNHRHYTGYNTLNGTVSGQGAVPSHVNRSMHMYI